jgi:hypothetical protein
MIGDFPEYKTVRSEELAKPQAEQASRRAAVLRDEASAFGFGLSSARTGWFNAGRKSL